MSAPKFALRDLVYLDFDKAASIWSQCQQGLPDRMSVTEDSGQSTAAGTKFGLLSIAGANLGVDYLEKRSTLESRTLHHDVLNRVELHLADSGLEAFRFGARAGRRMGVTSAGGSVSRRQAQADVRGPRKVRLIGRPLMRPPGGRNSAIRPDAPAAERRRPGSPAVAVVAGAGCRVLGGFARDGRGRRTRPRGDARALRRGGRRD